MQTNEPDLIPVDLRLQGSDSGINTLNAVEASHPKMHRMIITGETYLRFEENGLNTPVDVLHKPVDKRQVIELLASLRIGRTANAVSQSIA